MTCLADSTGQVLSWKMSISSASRSKCVRLVEGILTVVLDLTGEKVDGCKFEALSRGQETAVSATTAAVQRKTRATRPTHLTERSPSHLYLRC